MESEINQILKDGKWFWDNKTNQLAYYDPSNPTHVPINKKREKEHHFESTMEIKTIKITSGKNKHDTITLSDVKDVTLSRVTESVEICKNFQRFLNSRYIDVFLVRLLLYFSWYLQKKRMANEPSEMIIEKSPTEKAEYDRVCREVWNAKRLLGYSYATILLGMNNCKNHHMRCGKMHISDTYSDRLIFEALVRFSAVFVWIGLGRKDIDEIKPEINRLIGNKKQEEKKKDTHQNNGKGARANYSLKERSEVTISILPTSKDKSQHLYAKAKKGYDPRLHCSAWEGDLGSFFKETIEFDPYSVKVGIIGEKAELFNAINLSPIEDDSNNKKVASAEIKSNLSKYYERRNIYEERQEKIWELMVKHSD